MLPTPKSAHIDTALTNMSIGYRDQNFIADRVFPSVPVTKQSDYFYKFLKGAWFRLDAAVRGPGAKAAEGGYPITSDTYSCIERAIKHPVPIELINNADDVLKPLRTGVRYTLTQILLAKEKAVSDLCMTGSNWTTTEDANAGWLGTVDGTGNTFIADVLKAKRVIRQTIGRYPNVMLMDSKTLEECKKEYTVLERIKYTGTQGKPADVTAQTLAQLFELEEVLIGTSIYSSAEEIIAGTDFTAVDLWETNATKGSALLFYRPTAPAIEEPSAGYIFNWKGAAGHQSAVAQSDIYREVRKWWNDDRKSWMVESSEYFDAKATCADAGYHFSDTIVT